MLVVPSILNGVAAFYIVLYLPEYETFAACVKHYQSIDLILDSIATLKRIMNLTQYLPIHFGFKT